MGRRRAAFTPSAGLIHSFHEGYLLAGRKMRTENGRILPGLVVLALLLTGSPCFSQSAPTESPTPEGSKSEGDLFSQVIANQKRMDTDLNVYERVERVEIR